MYYSVASLGFDVIGCNGYFCGVRGIFWWVEYKAGHGAGVFL
jgi:hypothetical protein